MVENQGLVHRAFVTRCEKVNRPYLTHREAMKEYQFSQKCSFPVESIIEEVYQQLERKKFIVRATLDKSKERVIIPLNAGVDDGNRSRI